MKGKYNIPRATLEELYYRDRLSQREIASRLGCSSAAVCRCLAEYGLPTPRRNRVTFLRRRAEHYWRCQWSPEIAYAVGLITSDGCLAPDGQHVIFTSCDLALIESFRHCLRLSNRIREEHKSSISVQQCYRVGLGDVAFYQWLLDIGLMPDKSRRLNALNIPNEYFADFLRGYLDGDGSFSVYTDAYRHHMYKGKQYVYQCLYTRFYSASRQYLSWLQLMLTRLLGTNGAIIKKGGEEKEDTARWELRYAKEDSIRLVRWMYYHPDIPCLHRKRALVSQYLEDE